MASTPSLVKTYPWPRRETSHFFSRSPVAKAHRSGGSRDMRESRPRSGVPDPDMARSSPARVLHSSSLSDFSTLAALSVVDMRRDGSSRPALYGIACSQCYRSLRRTASS